MHVTLAAMCASMTKPAVIHVSLRPRRVSSRHRNPIRTPCSKPARLCVRSTTRATKPFSPGSPPLVLSGADSMRKSLLIYTQQLRRREAILIGVAAADLTNFTCHGNLGVKIDSQKLVRAGRQNGKAERMELTCWSQTLNLFFLSQEIQYFISR